MRLICQHCAKTIAFICPFCGDELTEPRVPEFRGTHKSCESGSTQIYFALETMPIIRSTCEECRIEQDQTIGTIIEIRANAEAERIPARRSVSP